MKKIFAIFYAAIMMVWCMTVSAENRQYIQRGMDPVVSTEWLAAHLNDSDLVVIDIRGAEEYSKGHIPESVNVSTENWWVTRNQLLLEPPDPDALRALIGRAGIRPDSKVVLVNKIDGDFDRSHPPYVGWTLIYGGVKNVAILDGGYNKWTSESRAVSTKIFTPREETYSGAFQERISVSKRYVESNLSDSRNTTIVDSRSPEDFFGVAPMMLSSKSGHIPGAACLPAAWAFTAKGTFKDLEELEAMAQGVVGSNREKRIIVYCGVGGFASTWWFVFSEMLGYRDVRLYSGSIQEWMMDPEAPVTRYQW
ncbi:MAG: sulfurtransferase [Acidobacteria bacterium]|nr:sulfurtransferase [Acidobacteriota bacterium]